MSIYYRILLYCQSCRYSPSTVICDLGISYDSNLDCAPYVDIVVKKAYFALHRMFCLFSNHDVDFYMHLYTVCIRPILEFCTPIWSPRVVYLINRIENVQRYFTRRLLGSELSYSDRLQVLSLKSLEERRIFFDVKLLHKIYFHSSYNLLQSHFRPVHSVRLHSNFCVNFCASEFLKHFWFNRVIAYWNMLPHELKICTNHKMFCNHLTNFSFESCLKGVAHT
jgi:hypothetical protein